jgi:hypothetical protein
MSKGMLEELRRLSGYTEDYDSGQEDYENYEDLDEENQLSIEDIGEMLGDIIEDLSDLVEAVNLGGCKIGKKKDKGGCEVGKKSAATKRKERKAYKKKLATFRKGKATRMSKKLSNPKG